MSFSPIATNPAELAMPYTGVVDTSSRLEGFSVEEERALEELDRLTDVAEMRGQYFAQAGRALAFPSSFEFGESVNYVSFDSVSFEGSLATYSVVKIGRVIGATSVRALCLAFDEVTLLPFFDRLPEDLLLHVPALAVDSMSRTDIES